MSDFELNSQDFSGTVRLFPLPDLVLFPHVVQPLRVFEPRYVALLEECLTDDQRFAIGLLRSGWETDYEGRPPIHSTVCLGRVLTHHRHPNGTYNVLLAGQARVKIVDELAGPEPFRRARGELLRDAYRDPLQQGSSHLRASLLEMFRRGQPQGIVAAPAVQKLLHDQVPLGVLTDVIAYASPLATADKQRLLEDPLVERRAAQLISLLRARLEQPAGEANGRFPPRFSDN